MTTGSIDPIEWSRLLSWYVSASDLLEDLDACRILAHSMLEGSTTANAAMAGTLDELTSRAELWLVSHPCPEPWNGDHLAAIVFGYMTFGSIMEEADWDRDEADRVTLKTLVAEGDLLVDEVRELVVRLNRVLDL